MTSAITYLESSNRILSIQDTIYGGIMVLFLSLALLIAGKLKYKGLIYKYFVNGLFLRIFISFLFVLVTHYITGGDSMMYYTGGRQITYADWTTFWDFIFSTDSSGWKDSTYLHLDEVTALYITRKSNLIVAKFASLPLLIADSYIFASACFSILGFLGAWKIFKTALLYFPNCHKYLAWGILYFPSCIYWSSSIGKDALCLFGLGILTNSFQKFFIGKKKRIRDLIYVILSSTLIFFTKSYIIFFFVLAFIFYFFLDKQSRIKNRIIRVSIFPITCFVIVIAGIFFLNTLDNFSFDERFSPDNLLENVATHQMHSKASSSTKGNNTKFDIGTFEPTVSSLLFFYPKAVFASLFRPLPLESSHPLMILLGLENLLVLLVALIILFRFGLFRLIKFILSNNYLIFCLVVALGFSGIIGISTNNFGTLSRYRLPIMPFFFTLLAVLFSYSKRRKISV